LLHIRNLEENEYEFLLDMMYESIYIPQNKPPKEELLNSPHIKKYHEGWGRKGDRALIAFNKDNQPVGAAWYRLFKENEKGYGYVDDNTPELGIAVIDAERGKGIGTLLMKKLFEQALKDGYTSVSLSVDPNNIKAVQLYKKLGFKQCGSSGTSWTYITFLRISFQRM
jgi:GNAT superfamily N-acetyltransferase